MERNMVNNILMLKKRTFNVDEVIKDNEELRVSSVENGRPDVSDKSTQTEIKSFKTTSSQTVAQGAEGEEPKPKKNFISFFSAKSLFNKKPKKKLVKFYQHGSFGSTDHCHPPTIDIPGHRNFTADENDFTLPHASEFISPTSSNLGLKRSPKKRVQRKPATPSPQKEKKILKESPISNQRKKKSYPIIQSKDETAGSKVNHVNSKLISNSNLNDVGVNGITFGKVQNIIHKPATPKRNSSNDQNLAAAVENLPLQDSPPSQKSPPATESSPLFQNIKALKPEKPLMTKTTTEKDKGKKSEKSPKPAVLTKKAFKPDDELIPLGREHLPAPSKNERSATFKLTPEALKAINARKAPTQKLPLRKPLKRPAKHNENDPTQKKRLRVSKPAVPAPPMAKEETIAKDLEMSDDEDEDNEEIIRPPKKKSMRFRILDDDDLDQGNDNCHQEQSPATIAKIPQLMEEKIDNRISNSMDTNKPVNEEEEEAFKTHSEQESEGSVSSTIAEIEQRSKGDTDILTLSETIEFEENEENGKALTKSEGNLSETEITTNNANPQLCNPGEPKNLKFSATKEVMESPRPTYDDEVVGNIVRRSMSEDGGDLFACDTTFLEYMVKKFKSDQSARQSEIDKKRASNRCDGNFDRNLLHNLVKSQLGRLWQNIDDANILYNIVKNLYFEDNPEKSRIMKRLIIQQLYIVVREEKEWENADYAVPGGAKMTPLQAKAFTLLVHLEPKMVGIMGDMALFLSMLTFATSQNGLNSYKLFQLANVTRMLIAIARHLGDEKMARMFLYDTIFFRNSRAHVMITIFIDTWPQLLQPQKVSASSRPNLNSNNCELVADPIFGAIIWMIYNAGPANSLSDLKVYEARDKLKRYCQQPKPTLTADDLIRNLFTIVEQNHTHKLLCQNATKALLLLAKWQEFNWANNHIVSRLLEMLQGWNDMDMNEKNRNVNVWVVNTLAHVIRIYPQGARDNLVAIFDSIKEIIKKEDIDQEMEEICLRAILWTGHHLQLQVAQFFFDWKPKFQLNKRMEECVANFVGLRARNFSEKTVLIKKREKVRGLQNNRARGRGQRGRGRGRGRGGKKP